MASGFEMYTWWDGSNRYSDEKPPFTNVVTINGSRAEFRDQDGKLVAWVEPSGWGNYESRCEWRCYHQIKQFVSMDDAIKDMVKLCRIENNVRYEHTD